MTRMNIWDDAIGNRAVQQHHRTRTAGLHGPAERVVGRAGEWIGGGGEIVEQTADGQRAARRGLRQPGIEQRAGADIEGENAARDIRIQCAGIHQIQRASADCAAAGNDIVYIV